MKFLSSYQNKYVKKSIKKRPKNKNSDVLFYIELDGLSFFRGDTLFVDKH